MTAYEAAEMDCRNLTESNVCVVVTQVNDDNVNCVEVEGEDFNIQFNKATGYMDRYTVDGVEMIKEGGALTPNFWRAPTDNDFGANLQNRFRVWLDPGVTLESLKHETVNAQVGVSAE